MTLTPADAPTEAEVAAWMETARTAWARGIRANTDRAALHGIALALARAYRQGVQEERERCATLAEEWPRSYESLAACIRAQEE